MEQDVLPLEPFWFGPFDLAEVYFRVEQANSCAFVGKVDLDLSQKPEYVENVRVNLCNGEIEIAAPLGYESYTWSTDATSQKIMMDEVGFVDVAFGNGPCTYVQTFEVLPEREIGVDEIEIIDFSKRENTILVHLDLEENEQNFQFSIDGGRIFQESNRFSNILPGLYDVVVSDGCSSYEKEVLVGGMPDFFTPNSDGTHDMLTMLNPEFFPAYTLSIFNRYGKLISTINANAAGWDGTFQNQEVPSDDYWYVLELANGRIVKGNFTLKR